MRRLLLAALLIAVPGCGPGYSSERRANWIECIKSRPADSEAYTNCRIISGYEGM